MTYVLAAYAVTILLVGGYAASVFARRRAARRGAATPTGREGA